MWREGCNGGGTCPPLPTHTPAPPGFGSDFCSGDTEATWRDRAELVRIAARRCGELQGRPVAARYHVGDGAREGRGGGGGGARRAFPRALTNAHDDLHPPPPPPQPPRTSRRPRQRARARRASPPPSTQKSSCAVWRRGPRCWTGWQTSLSCCARWGWSKGWCRCRRCAPHARSRARRSLGVTPCVALRAACPLLSPTPSCNPALLLTAAGARQANTSTLSRCTHMPAAAAHTPPSFPTPSDPAARSSPGPQAQVVALRRQRAAPGWRSTRTAGAAAG